MSESRGSIASKVCAAMMLAGSFVVLAAAFPAHAATGLAGTESDSMALAVTMICGLAAMAAVLSAVLRANALRPSPVPAKRPRR